MVPFRWVAASLPGARLRLRQRSVNHGTEVYNERVLQVRLLGGVAADHDGEQLSLLPPVSRLLAVLALRPGPQDRETVASTLWPGAAGAAVARANLRTAIWALRKAVGDDALITSRTAVGLRPEAVTVDLADGLRRAADGDADAAAALCRGELLPGYAEDWAETARRRQRAELAETLAARSAAAERDGDAAGAARWSRLRCELDPLNEAAHADLVRQLAAAGDRAGALVAGREATDRLRAELSVGPGPSLRAALAEARGPVAASTAPYMGSRPLYGRAAELRTLMAAWTAARAGHGRVVLITGEAGIGKTRLVAELARRAENAGARTAIGAGVDVGGAAPLATWQELVPQLARGVPAPPDDADWPAELGRLAPDIATRLGRDQPPPPVSSPELERLRVFDAVLRLVEWAAAGRPVLLVAEDVHRADPASMQLCAHIGKRLAARPVLFVLTRRDKPDRPDADALLADLAGRGVEVAELELGPLAAVELAAVARSVADLTDHAVDQVIRAADGNPLLAVESARALAAGRDAPPQNLRAAVRAAVGVLARPARDLAELLAAAGRELSAAELAAAYPTCADRPRRRGRRAGHRAGRPGVGGCASARCSPGGRADLETGAPLRAAGAGHRGGRRGPGPGGRRGGRPSAPGGPRRPGRTALAAGGPARPVAGRDAGGGPVLGQGRALRHRSRGPAAGTGRGLRLAGQDADFGAVAGAPDSAPKNGSRWPGPAAARSTARWCATPGVARRRRAAELARGRAAAAAGGHPARYRLVRVGRR